jgi:hypothetical protein
MMDEMTAVKPDDWQRASLDPEPHGHALEHTQYDDHVPLPASRRRIESSARSTDRFSTGVATPVTRAAPPLRRDRITCTPLVSVSICPKKAM